MEVSRKQTVLNLHNAGILPEIIAMQLDIKTADVLSIIRDEDIQNEKKEHESLKAFDAASVGLFYLDAIVNIDSIIKSAQLEMWKSINGELEANISNEDIQNVLARFAGSKVTFVILYIDIVGSTKLAMTLPVDKLAAIIRAFTHEVSLIVSAYGGYVLKYLGDAILAFFVVADKSNLYIPCVNSVQCARSMVKAVRDGFNPILSQADYPELHVRVGIDVGEVAVVQYGWSVQSSENGSKRTTSRRAYHDILGYTISVASKITGIAEPDHIVIGECVYDALDTGQKNVFKMLSLPAESWSYVSNKTGSVYKLYVRTPG